MSERKRVIASCVACFVLATILLVISISQLSLRTADITNVFSLYSDKVTRLHAVDMNRPNILQSNETLNAESTKTEIRPKQPDVFLQNNISQTRVLLHTYYRGGSSFLGNMFGANPKAFYWFEPLHFIMRFMYTKSKGDTDYTLMKNGTLSPLRDDITRTRTKVLMKTFWCDTTNLIQNVLKDQFYLHAQHMPKVRVYTACLKKHKEERDRYVTCAKLMKNLCTESSINSVKTIRYPMYLVADLLKDMPELKVIHYVRDPRGIMASRKTIHGFTGINLIKQTSYLCRKMAKDFQYFTRLKDKMPRNFYFTKYEDLALKPKETAQALYQFLGQDYPPSLTDWIEKHTKAKKSDWNYGTVRNSQKTVYHWRETLKANDLQQMTDVCKDTLHVLQYEPS